MCRSFFSILLLVCSACLWAQDAPDAAEPAPIVEKKDSIYRGIGVKFDLFTPIYTLASTSARTMSFELGANVNLLNRYFPTIEIGYAKSEYTAEHGAMYAGQGGFLKGGVDVGVTKATSTLKNLFYVGIRGAVGMQDYNLTNVQYKGNYWGTIPPANLKNQFAVDVWMEVLAGIQVSIYEGLYMGWAMRYKYLFTKADKTEFHAWYIPGFGQNTDSQIGFNYYIGYNF